MRLLLRLMPFSPLQKDRLSGLILGIVVFFLIAIVDKMTNPREAFDGGALAYLTILLGGLGTAIIFGYKLPTIRLLNILGGVFLGFLLTFLGSVAFFS